MGLVRMNTCKGILAALENDHSSGRLSRDLVQALCMVLLLLLFDSIQNNVGYDSTIDC